MRTKCTCGAWMDATSARCHQCGAYRPGSEHGILVEIALRILRDHQEWQHKAAVFELPPASFLLGSELDVAEEIRPVHTLDYKRRKVQTPAGPRFLYWRDEDTWLVQELLAITNEQLHAAWAANARRILWLAAEELLTQPDVRERWVKETAARLGIKPGPWQLERDPWRGEVTDGLGNG